MSAQEGPASKGQGLPKKRATAFVAVMVLAGGLFAVAARTADGSDLREDSGELSTLVEQQDKRVASLQTENSEKRERIEQLNASDAQGSGTAGLIEAGDRQADLAGQTPVTGLGLTVELTDAPKSSQSIPGVRPDDLVVHQQDLEAVVNALWAGGAEAMMLQDQRVISTSAFRCVGNTLLLKGRVYSPPFVVKAIGDPEAMREALFDSSEVSIYRQWVDAVGLGWKVTQGEIAMPGYTDSVELKYASVPPARPSENGG